MKKNIIIDTDPGVDDATAIIAALFSNELDIKLITTIAGNVGIKQTTRNTLYLLEKFNKNIKVVKGASKPMQRIGIDASNVHGKEGLGGHIPTKITQKAEKGIASDKLYETILENKNNITLVELAPHTNLGHLFLKHPEVEDYISLIVFEGGSPYGKPGVKPHISFNISYDPEAADIVIKTNIPKVIIPSELGRYICYFDKNQVETIKNTNETGKFLADMYDGYINKLGLDTTQTNDLCAILYLTHPEIFSTYQCDIEVDLVNTPGKTTITENKNGKITFVENVDREKFFKIFMDILKTMP